MNDESSATCAINKNMNIETQDPLIEALISEMKRSLELANTLSARMYSSAQDGDGSIGAHIRHNLDFVYELLRGAEVGTVDYSNRERNKRIERDQKYAAMKMQAAIQLLLTRFNFDMGETLTVRSEVRLGIVHNSSLSRELEFVYSHMVHHHALINERLRKFDMADIPGLGVSPSTMEYWNSFKKAA